MAAFLVLGVLPRYVQFESGILADLHVDMIRCTDAQQMRAGILSYTNHIAGNRISFHARILSRSSCNRFPLSGRGSELSHSAKLAYKLSPHLVKLLTRFQRRLGREGRTSSYNISLICKWRNQWRDIIGSSLSLLVRPCVCVWPTRMELELWPPVSMGFYAFAVSSMVGRRTGDGSLRLTHDPCDPPHSWPMTYMTHDSWGHIKTLLIYLIGI